jgi:hypothetical protein
VNKKLEHVEHIGRRHTSSAAAALALAASLFAACTMPVKEALPEGTEPMSAVNLYQIYRGKTWIWENGAGRFYIEEMRFLAWLSEEGGESYGEGHYSVSDDGELCIKATWAGAEGAAKATTCFLHRSARGTIYQKRAESGAWYVFKHEKATPSDEYNKLVSEDDVTERVARIKLALTGK